MKSMKWFKAKHGLAEAVSTGIEFAFASPDGKQSCQFCHCKDFLHDAVRCAFTGKPDPIYSFDYDPTKNPPIGFDKIRILVVNCEDRDLRAKIPACLDFLHQFEDRLKMENTTAEECQAPPAKYKTGGAWLFEGSERWIAVPVMVSLYTLLIRVGMGHDLGKPFMETIEKIEAGTKTPYCSADSSRIRGGKKGIMHILNRGDLTVFPSREIKDNYPSVPIHTFHNYFGIVGFTSGSCNSQTQWVKVG